MTKLKNKISDSADTVYHTVVDTIKAHPVPAALVGAGVGWLIYERTRSTRSVEDSEEEFRGLPPYEDDFSPDPVPGPAPRAEGSIIPDEQGGYSGSAGSFSEEGEPSGPMDTFQQKASEVRERLRETGIDAKGKARRIYETTRDRMTSAVETHPLQTGLIFLAVGLVAGLLIPTPSRLRQRLKPAKEEEQL